LHVSPLWALAIVSDLAHGARTYVEELAQELQKLGVIDDASTIHKVDDLLGAVQRASGAAASTLDLPPLSLQELQSSVDETRRALADIDPRLILPETEIRRYWRSMCDLAQQEDVSLLGVSGALTMQALSSAKAVGQGAISGVQVAGSLLNRTLFSHYADALARLQSQGLWTTLSTTYEPYVQGVWENFGPQRTTWTERLLTPGTYRSAWTGLQQWLSPPEPPADPEAHVSAQSANTSSGEAPPRSSAPAG
jgi:hypothetical protein